ncbi:MAG: hypothetical protein JWM44_2276 [Bacilli bacterium]|nr:hypothetical protein [Bacilli bacterium]
MQWFFLFCKGLLNPIKFLYNEWELFYNLGGFVLKEYLLKPLGFGRILDRSFQVYRNHFVKLMLLVLILYCPLYLFEGFIYSKSGSGSSPFNGSMFSNNLTDPAAAQAALNGSIVAIILGILFAGLIMIALFPVAVAAVVFLVDGIYKGESISLGKMLSRSFKRFWALLGNSLLYGLILAGISIVCYIAMIIIVVIGALLFSFKFSADGFQHPSSIVGLIVIILALVALLYIGVGYFAIRWGFFLPPVALKKGEVGIGKSWGLTKGSFWRLLAVFFTLTIIIYAFILIYSVLVSLLPGSVVKAVLLILMNIIVSPLLLVTYAVSYFDLKVRTEGSDLESMLSRSNATFVEDNKVESIEGND